MASWLSGRRGFLRFSSIFPVSVVASSAVADNTEFCENVPEHPAVGNSDPQYAEVSAILWDKFVEGTRAMGETPVIPIQTENHIRAQQGVQLKRKVRFWTLCEQETSYCCFSAGVIADAARRAEGAAEISIQNFDVAKKAVKATQANRLGRAPVGIAC